MTELPPWLQAEAVRDLLADVREQQAATRTARNRYLERLDESDLEAAVDAKRDYQQAALEQRHVEGELLWGALGYAITDIAETADADEEAVNSRGESFLSWAIDTELLETATDRRHIEIEVARRYPTLAESHIPYVESMLDLEQTEIATLREHDQARLSSAGWSGEDRTGKKVTVVPCPHCRSKVAVSKPADALVQVTDTLQGEESEWREICPHCERDVFVGIAAE